MSMPPFLIRRGAQRNCQRLKNGRNQTCQDSEWLECPGSSGWSRCLSWPGWKFWKAVFLVFERRKLRFWHGIAREHKIRRWRNFPESREAEWSHKEWIDRTTSARGPMVRVTPNSSCANRRRRRSSWFGWISKGPSNEPNAPTDPSFQPHHYSPLHSSPRRRSQTSPVSVPSNLHYQRKPKSLTNFLAFLHFSIFKIAITRVLLHVCLRAFNAFFAPLSKQFIKLYFPCSMARGKAADSDKPKKSETLMFMVKMNW